MALHVEVSYYSGREEWLAMLADENERQAGDMEFYRIRDDAIRAAKEHGLPVRVFTKAGHLYMIIHPK